MTRHSRRVNAAVRIAMIVVGAVALVFGCATPPVAMDSPEGFARFSDTEEVRAISPEGVLVRARLVDNDPAQSIEFWAQALERQLADSGYLLVDSADFTADGEDGRLMEWLAPVAEDDWIYLTAIAVLGEKIAVVEAAGPAGQYQEYRSAIRDSLRTLRLENDNF